MHWVHLAALHCLPCPTEARASTKPKDSKIFTSHGNLKVSAFTGRGSREMRVRVAQPPTVRANCLCNPKSRLRKSFVGDWPSSKNGFASESLEGRPATKTPRKSYILPMFPYPSGTLHMGHVRVYTISDVIARYKRMKGDDVLHPMGWDAFGLPAENAAIERGIDPRSWTDENISKMRKQLKDMGVQFDWDREIATCSPSFYKHTQKLFLMLYRRGLAYQAKALVNWDPVDKTVLANEQVDSNGRSWRSGATVERKELRQWFFRITAFQDQLHEDLALLKQWPQRVLTQQKNWLGKSEGARLEIQIYVHGKPDHLHVYTTRPDTLFGMSYIALSINHPLVKRLAKGSSKLREFLQRAKSLAADSKEGFLLSGVSAYNPVDKLMDILWPSLPVYVAPYVLSEYAEGAVMGVPAHDARDLAFWREQKPEDYAIVAVLPKDSPLHEQAWKISELREAYSGHGVLTEICRKYSGLDSKAAGRQMVADLHNIRSSEKETEGSIAEPMTKFRLRDWLISRQRYWGTPIPIIHCKPCGAVPVPDDQLPVELPRLDKRLVGKVGNPLGKIADWVNVPCPSCGQPAKRETDTMDTFVDSAWYFTRFPDSTNESNLFSEESAQQYLPVDTYVGGVEHAILHLLYARFIYKFLVSEDLIPDTRSTGNEPFERLISQGMVHGKTFSDPQTGRFLQLADVVGADTASPTIKASGLTPTITYEKMSKSKHNGVDPSTCIAKYTADVTRAHMLFSAPVSDVLEWDEEKIVGIQRWFSRIKRLIEDTVVANPSSSTLALLISGETTPLAPSHLTPFPNPSLQTLLTLSHTITSVAHVLDQDLYALNTTISDLIKLTNSLSSSSPPIDPAVQIYAVLTLLRLLHPIAPSFTQTQYTHLLTNPSIIAACTHAWGAANGQVLASTSFPNVPLEAETVTWAETTVVKGRGERCTVQINGRVRFSVDIDGEGAGEEGLVEKVLATAEGREWLLVRNSWATKKRVVVVKRREGGWVVNVVF